MIERTYRIHIAAEMSGVSEGLIRAWERRYGVLKPRRTASGYRAYTEHDIEVLRRLKKLTEEGVAIAEAVRLLPQLKREAKESLEQDALVSIRVPAEEQYGKWRQEILRGAEFLDQQAVERVLDEGIAAVPPLVFFDEIVTPVQQEIGVRWHDGRLNVTQEHLVTHALRQRLMLLLQQAPRRAKKHIVCACFPDEEHDLGLIGVALRFRHAGWRVTYLGARTPLENLATLVRSVLPDVVALSSINDLGEASFAQHIAAAGELLSSKTKLVVGGPVAVKYRQVALSHHATVIAEVGDWMPIINGA
jgi:MerR family transcriptional regulator, light-induced transcriptional regulator